MGLSVGVDLLEVEVGLSVGVDKPAELSGEDLRVAVSMEGLLVEEVGAFPVLLACQIQLSHFEQRPLFVEPVGQYHPVLGEVCNHCRIAPKSRCAIANPRFL